MFGSKAVFSVGFGIDEDRHGQPISLIRRWRALRTIKRRAASAFGGFTLHRGQGGWFNGKRRLVLESSCVLTVCVDCPDGNWRGVAHDDFAAFCQLVGQDLGQAAVVVYYPDGSADISETVYL